MSKICPQRIIKSAAQYLEKYRFIAEDDDAGGDLIEAIDNTISELMELEQALYKAGIINIDG